MFRIQDIVDAFNTQPEKDKEAFIFHYRDGETFTDIAKREGCSFKNTIRRSHQIRYHIGRMVLPLIDGNGNLTGETGRILDEVWKDAGMRCEHNIEAHRLGFDLRTPSILRDNNIYTIQELYQLTEKQLQNMPGMTKASYSRIMNAVGKSGVSLGVHGQLTYEDQKKMLEKVKCIDCEGDN